jgi:hypothetical protein
MREKTQELGGADDPDAAKLLQLQQLLISADDVLRMASRAHSRTLLSSGSRQTDVNALGI